MFSYERLAPPALGGGGFWHFSCMFLFSVVLEVLDFSDDTLADLLVPSNFSFALHTGFCPADLLGPAFILSRLLALLASRSSSGKYLSVEW